MKLVIKHVSINLDLAAAWVAIKVLLHGMCACTLCIISFYRVFKKVILQIHTGSKNAIDQLHVRDKEFHYFILHVMSFPVALVAM